MFNLNDNTVVIVYYNCVPRPRQEKKRRKKKKGKKNRKNRRKAKQKRKTNPKRTSIQNSTL